MLAEAARFGPPMLPEKALVTFHDKGARSVLWNGREAAEFACNVLCWWVGLSLEGLATLSTGSPVGSLKQPPFSLEHHM